MRVKMKSLKFKILGHSVIFLSLLTFFYSSEAEANCVVQNTNANLGTYPSTQVENGQVESIPFSSGLNCTGLATVASATYLKYVVNNVSSSLVNINDPQKTIPLEVYERFTTSFTNDGTPVRVTNSYTESIKAITLLSLFFGPDGNLSMFATVPVQGTKIVPGTYRGTLTITWFYSIPALAILGLGNFYESPGFDRPLLGIGDPEWGSGITSTMTIELTVDRDCSLLVTPINFGTAPFAQKFNPVTNTLQIRCSAGTPYSVGLSNGSSGVAPRTMINQTDSSKKLAYEIYKANTIERWGNLGSERWHSDDATRNSEVYDGSTYQEYDATAKILDSNSNALPSGTYKDNVIVEVEF